MAPAAYGEILPAALENMLVVTNKMFDYHACLMDNKYNEYHTVQ